MDLGCRRNDQWWGLGEHGGPPSRGVYRFSFVSEPLAPEAYSLNIWGLFSWVRTPAIAIMRSRPKAACRQEMKRQKTVRCSTLQACAPPQRRLPNQVDRRPQNDELWRHALQTFQVV